MNKKIFRNKNNDDSSSTAVFAVQSNTHLTENVRPCDITETYLKSIWKKKKILLNRKCQSKNETVLFLLNI